MKNIVRYLKLTGIFIGIVMFSALLFGLLNLIGLNYKITTVLNIVVMVILFLVFGFIEGLNTSKKGFVAGFKIGILFIIVLVLFNLIWFKSSFFVSRLVYYLILILSSVVGAMIGINRKKKD